MRIPSKVALTLLIMLLALPMNVSAMDTVADSIYSLSADEDLPPVQGAELMISAQATTVTASYSDGVVTLSDVEDSRGMYYILLPKFNGAINPNLRDLMFQNKITYEGPFTYQPTSRETVVYVWREGDDYTEVSLIPLDTSSYTGKFGPRVTLGSADTRYPYRVTLQYQQDDAPYFTGTYGLYSVANYVSVQSAELQTTAELTAAFNVDAENLSPGHNIYLQQGHNYIYFWSDLNVPIEDYSMYYVYVPPYNLPSSWYSYLSVTLDGDTIEMRVRDFNRENTYKYMKHLPLYYKVHTSPPNLSALDNSDAKLLTGDAPARVDLLPDEAGDWRWVTFWYGTTSEYLPFSRTTSIKIRNRNEGLQLTEDRQRSRVTVTNQDEIPYEWNYRIGVTLDADTGSNVSAIYTPGFSPSTTYVPRNYGKVTSPNRLVARLDNRYPLSDVNSGYSMTTTDIAEDVKPFEYAPPAFTGDWDSEKAMSISRWEDS